MDNAMLTFIGEKGLHQVNLVSRNEMDEETKAFLAKVKCRVDFRPHEPCKDKPITVRNCRITELHRDQDGHVIGFDVDYEIAQYEDGEEVTDLEMERYFSE